MSDPAIQVFSEDFEKDYDKTIINVCEALWAGVLSSSYKIVNEKEEPVTFNVADICNTLTNVIQKYRVAHAASEQV